MRPDPEKENFQDVQLLPAQSQKEKDVENLQENIKKLKQSLVWEKEIRNEFHAEYDRMKKQLEEKDKLLKKVEQDATGSQTQKDVTDMIFGIAHQIRNPISIVKSNAEMIWDSPHLSADEKIHVDVILRQIQSLEKRIEQLKFLSQPLQPIFRIYSLDSLMTKTISVLEERGNAQKITISANKIPKALFVKADEKMLMEAMLHIGINAVESMPNGGALEIIVNENMPAEHVSITFRDTGTGMEQDTLANLGKPFFTTKSESLGIGMTRTFKIVSIHFGRLTFKSQPGIGTLVNLVLPLTTNQTFSNE